MIGHHRHRINLHPRVILSRLIALVRQPIFVVITLWGNIMTFGAAAIFFHFENGLHPSFTFLDSLLWSVGIITTVGYSPIAAVSTAGKLLSIFMMITGTVFIWTYMALFVSALIGPELSLVETDIKKLETELKKLESEVQDISPLQRNKDGQRKS